MTHFGLIFLLLAGLAAKSHCAARAAALARACIEVAGGPPATQPADRANGVSVHGTVRAKGLLLPAEMVVYLEPIAPLPGPAAPASRVRVSQKGAQFSPALTVVSVGQTVEFVNDEDRPVEHNVFSNAVAGRFDLGVFPPGQGRTVVFDKPGAVVLYCSIHKFMDGIVYVCPAPLFSKIDSDGTYRIDDVPAGKYTLKTWQRRRRFPEQAVALDVVAVQDLGVDLELHRK
jgi:plastocyanin